MRENKIRAELEAHFSTLHLYIHRSQRLSLYLPTVYPCSHPFIHPYLPIHYYLLLLLLLILLLLLLLEAQFPNLHLYIHPTTHPYPSVYLPICLSILPSIHIYLYITILLLLLLLLLLIFLRTTCLLNTVNVQPKDAGYNHTVPCLLFAWFQATAAATSLGSSGPNPLNMGPTGCPETLVTNYQSAVHYLPDYRRILLSICNYSHLQTKTTADPHWPVTKFQINTSSSSVDTAVKLKRTETSTRLPFFILHILQK